MSECTYLVKSISFLNRPTRIVTQNVNGPCPLLALVNVLLLRNAISLPSFEEETIREETLLSLVAQYLLDANDKSAQGPGSAVDQNLRQNMSDAISLLPQLRAGLDVNVRFQNIEDMEFTQQLTVFDLAGTRLVHGWVVDPQDRSLAKAVGRLSYNQVVERVIASNSPRKERNISRDDSHTNANSQGAGLNHGMNHDTSSSYYYSAPHFAENNGYAMSQSHTQRIAEPREAVAEPGAYGINHTASLQQDSQASQQTTSNRYPELNHAPEYLGTSAPLDYLGTSAPPDCLGTSAPPDYLGASAPPKCPKPSAPTVSDFGSLPDYGSRGPPNVTQGCLTRTQSSDEAALLRDFLRNTASQLTAHGIQQLHDNVRERELAVFFRNNHFSVLFKYDGAVYLLVTDQGYLSVPEVVWEKFVGYDGETAFVNSEFKEYKPADQNVQSSLYEGELRAAEQPYDNYSQPSVQADRDLAMAIQLQLEEASLEEARNSDPPMPSNRTQSSQANTRGSRNANGSRGNKDAAHDSKSCIIS